jgi:F0F1-type ATP synthase delta subunit
MVLEQTVTLRLPPSILGINEVNQALREIDLIEDQAMQHRIYRAEIHNSTAGVLSVSNSLNELAINNGLDLDDGVMRSKLKGILSDIKQHAPVIHMGLAREITNAELIPIIDWMRSNLHPDTLLNVGLQPDIIGGCTIRTPNRYYDFSLKKHFETARVSLLTKIKAL